MAKLFAGMLLQLRQESGVSQRDAAAALGISQSLLSHYEKGSREPRLNFLIRAASYYHVTTDFLLGCSPERARSDRQPDVLSEKNRVLVETMRFILTHLEADDDPVFSEAAVRYISLAMYKICRYLCLAVPATAEHFAADAQCFSEYADAAITNALAKDLIRRDDDVVTDGSRRGIVNVDTLSRSFSAGERVDINTLKSHSLIPYDTAYIKVLARGIIDKPLYVYANDFSLSAVKMIALSGGKAVKVNSVIRKKE